VFTVRERAAILRDDRVVAAAAGDRLSIAVIRRKREQ
jgi:hypothetical protein